MRMIEKLTKYEKIVSIPWSEVSMPPRCGENMYKESYAYNEQCASFYALDDPNIF